MRMLQHWSDLADHAPSPSVSKRTIPGNGASLVHITITAGTVADRHTHPFEQFVQVISGAGMLETEEGTAPFRAGSLFHFPAGAWHAARFDEDTILVETNLKSSA